jgi:K+-sensing histidine kinase KdpD
MTFNTCFDFFLTEPYRHFTITDRADVETAVLLLLVGITGARSGRRRQRREPVE